MHAITATESGFTDSQTPDPELRSRDLLVRVHAVSVNPVDVKVRDGMDPGAEPRILGFDAAGVVEALGPQASGFSVGDEVWYAGALDRPGSDAELQAVDERLVARRPSSVSAAAAASLPLCAITAWESLHDHLAIEGTGVGRTLLVVGAGGGVGSILLQIARVRHPQLTVVATASRPETREWVSGLGADHVIDHHDLVSSVRAVAPSGVDHVFSAYSAGNEAAFAELLTPLGHIVAIDDPETVDLPALKPKAIAWHWEFMFSRSMFQTADMDVQGRLLGEVARLVDDGAVRTTETEVISDFSAAGIARAHELVRDGRMVGKAVVAR